MSAGTCLSAVMATRMVLLAVSITLIKGECTFNASWTGRWFQSGVPNLLKINSTHIETKGECYEKQIAKYLVYDRSDNCYRCMAIHGKDASVIQYKETFCESKASMQEICNRMTGDAALYSMFRKYPEAKPISCPFKSAPFTFSYSRGSGECSNPPSRAESCTDDSRLVLKYQACPDVPSTESNVEELVCLATWKEGSTRYLVGKISQGNRRNLITDEDQYRCFIYQREKYNDKTIYSIAQSADATCSGIQNAFEGSKTMRFTTVDNHHNRCKFPKWITDHHTWVSLGHLKRYKFTQKNATLNIMDEEKPQKKVHVNVAQPLVFQELGIESKDQRQQNSEKHMICHAILESQDQIKVQIVAHITAGCESGYVCMVFYKRDSNVIEIQQSEDYVENPDEACANFNPTETSYITLITATLHIGKCPHLGRYTVPGVVAMTDRRKREQPVVVDSQPPPECLTHDYESLAVGCGGSHEMEFKSTCAQQSINAYSCHGSWKENGIHYVITSLVARKSTEPLRYCFIYTIGNQLQPIIEGLEKPTQNPILRISSVSESCHRHVIPGVTGNWAYNFTSSGACTESADPNSTTILVPTLVIFMSTILALLVMR